MHTSEPNDLPDNTFKLSTQSKNMSDSLIRSEILFHGQKTVLIAHGEEIYQLRITQNNKLILTK